MGIAGFDQERASGIGKQSTVVWAGPSDAHAYALGLGSDNSEAESCVELEDSETTPLSGTRIMEAECICANQLQALSLEIKS